MYNVYYYITNISHVVIVSQKQITMTLTAEDTVINNVTKLGPKFTTVSIIGNQSLMALRDIKGY
jgi:hypothetical protein